MFDYISRMWCNDQTSFIEGGDYFAETTESLRQLYFLKPDTKYIIITFTDLYNC